MVHSLYYSHCCCSVVIAAVVVIVIIAIVVVVRCVKVQLVRQTCCSLVEKWWLQAMHYMVALQ